MNLYKVLLNDLSWKYDQLKARDKIRAMIAARQTDLGPEVQEIVSENWEELVEEDTP